MATPRTRNAHLYNMMIQHHESLCTEKLLYSNTMKHHERKYEYHELSRQSGRILWHPIYLLQWQTFEYWRAYHWHMVYPECTVVHIVLTELTHRHGAQLIWWGSSV